MGTLGAWQVLAVAGLSTACPQGVLWSVGCTWTVPWRGSGVAGKVNVVPGDEQGAGGEDLTTQPDAELRPYPVVTSATAWLETGSPLGLSLPRHRRPTQARRGRCLQMPRACPAQKARLRSYLTCKAREPPRQRQD